MAIKEEKGTAKKGNYFIASLFNC